MYTVSGRVAFGGIAIGRVQEFVKEKQLVERLYVKDTKKELRRFEQARQTAFDELGGLYEHTLAKLGETNAAIFEIHQMLLEDDDYLDFVKNMIETQQVNAEFAVAVTADHFAKIFSEMDNEYMKGRAADIKDVSERVIEVLCHADMPQEKKEISDADEEEPVIIMADDLAPSETIQLGKRKVLAFVMRRGTVTSHTAILARTMNIPSLVCTPLAENITGKLAIVDGSQGKLIVEPDEETFVQYKRLQEEQNKRQELLRQFKGKKSVTRSGKEIRLYANISGVKDVSAALENDAEGIGLFRSEFLYLQGEDYPTEEEQFDVYKTVAEMMVGRQVIIRTLDIGADKQISYFGLDKEENPALGYRAVRICLDRPELFRTQLRAIYRASAYGRISIMVPMIASTWEVKKVRAIAEEVKAELQEQGMRYGEVAFGIMIETPAAVMIADELAELADFFSIGTNDLTQYTLAVDRQNPKLDAYLDTHHPAVLRMIRMVIESAHKAGIWAGICGELGADTELTEAFIEMGIDELSVSPAGILPVREKIIQSHW